MSHADDTLKFTPTMHAIRLTDERRARGFVQVEIPGHGLFTGYLDTITAVASHYSQTQLANRVVESWPDLFTRKWARAQSPFTLALILNQE